MSSLKSVGIAGVLALFGIAAVGSATLSPAVRIIAPAEAATASKLGDLSSFRTIVVDTAGFVDKAIFRRRRRGSRIWRRHGTRPNPR